MKKEVTMIRATMVILLSILLLITAGNVVGAELAKEGSGDYRGAKSGTMEVLPLGEGRIQMNWDEKGAFSEAPENSPFINATFHAIGTLYGIKGKSKIHGGMVITRPNGDQIFGAIVSEGIVGRGPTGGGIEFLGGTGECSGITGKIDLLPRPKVKASKKGTYQHVIVGKVTWKIP